MEEQSLCALLCATVDSVIICRSISLIYIAHVAVIIRHSLRALWTSHYYSTNYSLPVHRVCLSKYVGPVCPSTVLLSSHPYSVLEGRHVGVLFARLLSPVACPSCWVWQCHKGKCASLLRHQISLGRSNCPYRVCGTTFYFLCQFWYCRVCCSQVLYSSLSVSAQINCHIICVLILVTELVNFDLRTFVFLGYILSENDPSVTQYN